MLLALKKQMVPTDFAAKQDIRNRYAKLKKYLKRKNLEVWIRDWEEVIHRVKALKIPEITDTTAIMDFLYTVREESPIFVSYWIPRVEEEQVKGKEALTFSHLLQCFRQHIRNQAEFLCSVVT